MNAWWSAHIRHLLGDCLLEHSGKASLEKEHPWQMRRGRKAPGAPGAS